MNIKYFFIILLFPFTVFADQEIEQQSQGDNSPVIHSEGNVTVSIINSESEDKIKEKKEERYKEYTISYQDQNHINTLIDTLSDNKHKFIKLELKLMSGDGDNNYEKELQNAEVRDENGNTISNRYSLYFSLDPCSEKSLLVAPERKSYNDSKWCGYMVTFDGKDQITRCHASECDIIGYFNVQDIAFEWTEGIIHYDLRSLKPEDIP